MATKKQSIKKPNNSKAVVLSNREAPIERQMSDAEIIQSVMTRAQMEILLERTPEHAIKVRQGPGGKMMKYIPHGYVTDRLNLAFGFEWDYKLLPYFAGSVYHLETIELGVNNRTKDPIIARYVSVYGELTVRIHNPKKPMEVVATITKPGPGSAVWYKENELGDAIKAAKSDGLKVAAHELGIGLDLYWDDIAEQNKLEELRNQAEQQKRKMEADEIIDATSEDIPAPDNGVAMLAMAIQFGYDFAKLIAILGRDEIINSYTVADWEKIVKHYQKENKKK